MTADDDSKSGRGAYLNPEEECILNSRVVLYLLGKIIYFLGLVYTVPLLLALWFGDEGRWIFSVCIPLCFLIGMLMTRYGLRPAYGKGLSNREGILTVVLTWVLAAVLGALPFILAGMLDPAGAFFEAMSGLTTTGATALSSIEGWPKSLLFWRVWMHWLGGLGIIVIFIALLPGITGGAVHLFNTESTGFSDERFRPRLKEMARSLFYIYTFITGMTAFVLLLGGVGLFDAATHAMSAVATGGFSHFNDSVAHFHSGFAEIVLGIAMVISGGNFSLYYQLLHRGPGVLWRDDEFRWYMGLLSFLTVLVAADLVAEGGSSLTAGFRAAFFQVASFASTTGYVSADYDQWPALARVCLMLLYFTGACAGSTAGGIKISRFLVLLRGVRVGAARALHSRDVRPILFNRRKIESPVFHLVLNFFFLYIGVFIVFSAAVTGTGAGIQEAVTGVAACLSSAGPGFGPVVGATGNFSTLPAAAKILLAFVMLLGRLEMYAVLVLFHRGFWSGRSRWERA